MGAVLGQNEKFTSFILRRLSKTVNLNLCARESKFIQDATVYVSGNMVFETTRRITISVVGYPGSGTGVRQHVGKSCLINRFMAPYRFNENHLSILSLSDFDSEVISSSHWLYWGENSVDIGSNKLQIRVIEQCDFVDDHIFQPFFERRTYAERCLDYKISVHSRKLSYVCKEQLGHESDFPQVYLEPTTLFIDVFVCVYDMSLCGPPALQQAAFMEYVITRLSSLKLPVIIATSKHDTDVSAQASTLFNNALHRCKKRCVRNLCIVETSSRLNVNVKTVFQCAAFFGHHKRTCKLRSGLLYCSLKRSDVRRSFTMCFRKSVWSSIRWFQYNTSLCDTNLHSIGSDSQNAQRKSCFSLPVQSLTLPNQHNELRIPERIILPQMIAVTDPSIPVTNPGLLLKRKAHQLDTDLFSVACFPQNSSVQDITLTRTNDACDPSVLPTPPPLLLPGPHNTISFQPNGSTTKICKSVALSPECSDLSQDTPLENPFVEINLRGHVDTSNYIATAIHDLCLLEHHTSKDGHQFRFSIRSNSKNRDSQPPVMLNPLPFYSDPSNRRPNGLTVQPIHMPLTSQISAFSAPNHSPLGSSFRGVFSDNHKNNKVLNPIAQQLHDDLAPVNANLTSSNLYNSNSSNSLKSLKANHLDTLAECCVYLFIYKNIEELLGCYKQIKLNKPISTTQKTINVLAYLSCSSCDTLEKRNLILSGLAISSRFKIPYLIVNSESTSVFLDNLLYMATNYQIGNDEITHTSNPNNSFVDWRCFTNVDYLSILPEFICSPITVWNELITEGKFQFVGLLTAVILSNCHPLNDCTHLNNTNHTSSHLSPKSIHEDPLSYCKTTKKNFSCLYAHFVQLDQVMESVLYRYPMTSSLRALLIHYSSSSWSDVGIHIENSLKKLCSLFDSSTFGDDNFTPVILMVAFHSGSSQQIPLEAEGIVHGLKLIQHLAQDYGCSLLLPSSEYDAVKVQFGKSPMSSYMSTGYESDHINCFQHPFIYESTHSRKNSKFSLGFLSVSRSDDVRAELYKRVFEGKFSDLYSSFRTPKTSDDSFCQKVSVNNNRYCSNIRALKDCMRKPQVVSNSQNVNSLRSSLLRHPHDVIALPWLPLNATDAFRSQNFRPPPTQCSFSETPCVKNSHSNIIGELDNHKYLSPQNIFSSAEFGGVLSSVLCGQVHQTLPTSSPPQDDMFRSVYSQSCSTAIPLPSINSSVEEYYAELPKVTQSVSLELESRRPHPNRPKRPHHHSDSAYSHSSSPSLSNRQILLPISTVFDQSRTDLCNSACAENSLLPTNDHQTLDNGSTVYAEVNDAFVYKTIPQCFPLSSSSNKPPHTDHYELTDYSVQQLNNLTLYPNLSRTNYTSKICDNAHKNGSFVAHNSGKIFYSNSSRSNQLSSSFTQHTVSSNPSFGRSSSQFNPKLTNLPAVPLDETSSSTSIHSCSNFFSPVPLLWTPTQVVRLPIAYPTYLANGCPTLLSSWSTCKENSFSTVSFKEISKVPDSSAHRLRRPADIFPIESSNSLLPAIPVGAPCESPSLSQRYQKRHPICVDPVVSNLSPIICDLSNHRKRLSLNILSAAVKRYNIWSRYISYNSHNSKT
ncbi:hypothetical protein MN116_006145 [Schistosoma mekongi]|uniref:Rho GTPase-activating protein n=1 Tax=Schistosoma mekongi TaxID=38744 RepID=A0AAE2D489_SCHME|nr:hypothetical protein MN116_006145 [Schistosoma mekongi]